MKQRYNEFWCQKVVPLYCFSRSVVISTSTIYIITHSMRHDLQKKKKCQHQTRVNYSWWSRLSSNCSCTQYLFRQKCRICSILYSVVFGSVCFQNIWNKWLMGQHLVELIRIMIYLTTSVSWRKLLLKILYRICFWNVVSSYVNLLESTLCRNVKIKRLWKKCLKRIKSL